MRCLDVEALETREHLRSKISPQLAAYGLKDLDISIVRGADRRITRWISQFAYVMPDVAGIRYLSRLDSAWECWAVFDRVDLLELESRALIPTDEAVQSVAVAYGLTVF